MVNKISKKILLFFNIIFSLSICITHLLATIFIDIDEFKFLEDQKSGIRICQFNIDKQKYEDINYYSFQTSNSREPRGNLFDEYSNYNFSIDYHGNIKINSFLEDIIIRIKGDLQGNIKGLFIYEDDQKKE